MKFYDQTDVSLFLIEVGRSDLLTQVSEGYSPTDDLVEILLHKRRTIIGSLKDFRKSQNAKGHWRKNRYSIMRGIKRFHKSTKGKRFHRELGNFLTRKIFDKSIMDKDNRMFPNRSKRDASEHLVGESLLFMTESVEVLKSLSSLKTHLYIESQYYMPLYEHSEFSMFSEELLLASQHFETACLYEEKWVGEQDMDIILRAIIPECLVGSVADMTGSDYAKLRERFDELHDQESLSLVEILLQLDTTSSENIHCDSSEVGQV